jgi:hypothetical protein
MQTPRGASKAPISTMATVARPRKPLSMSAVYHDIGFVE